MEPILESTSTTHETASLVRQSRMSWGAVFAGWAVAVGFASLMYVAGLALGFSAFDADDAEAAAKGFSIATGAWVVLTWIAALFLGGLFASWFDGNNDPTMGTMHGVTVWGLSIVFSGILVALGAAQIAHAGTALLLGTAPARSAHAAAATDQTLDALKAALQAKLTLSARQRGNLPLPAGIGAAPVALAPATLPDRPAMAAATAALVTSHQQTAKDILAANTTLTTSQIDAAVADASGQVQQYEIAAQTTAERAARYAAMGLWTAFISSLLGMLAAALGGWLGAGHVHRVYHLRSYAPLPNHAHR